MADLVRVGNVVLNMDTVHKFLVLEGKVEVEYPGVSDGYLNLVTFTGDDAEALRRWLRNTALDLTSTDEQLSAFRAYRESGGPMLFSEWREIYSLHRQYIESDRLSPYEGELRL